MSATQTAALNTGTGTVDAGEIAKFEAMADEWWDETGKFINLAIAAGAAEGLGYGESVGKFAEEETVRVPSVKETVYMIERELERGAYENVAPAADLLDLNLRFPYAMGNISVPHPFKRYGLQAAAYRLSVPFTGHPMFSHDIIYTHRYCHGASIARAAERDFLTYAHAVSQLEGGVYMSIGSAVMSPMVFEKSLSMAQNLAVQRGEHIDNHYILVADLQESHWDWTQGEPPEDNPDYYLRYNKTFSRMGGTMRYVTADNRDLLLALAQMLGS